MKILLLLLLPLALFAEIGYVEPWGRDAGLAPPTLHTPSSTRSSSLAAKAAEAVIGFHHSVLTHIDGPRSHYRPSSSTYMLEAIRTHGFLKGYLLGCDRLLRENGETWHYRTRLIDGKLFKWDPPPLNK